MRIKLPTGIQQVGLGPEFDPVEREILDLIGVQETRAGEIFSSAFTKLMHIRHEKDFTGEELAAAVSRMVAKEWIVPTDETSYRWRLTELGARNVAAISPVER